MTFARTIVLTKTAAPNSPPTLMNTPDCSEAAESEEMMSGEPFARASSVIPMIVWERPSSWPRWRKLGVRYFSAVDFRKTKRKKTIKIFISRYFLKTL